MRMKTRQSWITNLWKISEPVLAAAAHGQLKSSMPVWCNGVENRLVYSHLEAVGRMLAGISPWLQLEGLDKKETEVQGKARLLAQKALTSITDPNSVDFLNFTQGSQPLVDAAYLAQAILRAPDILWKQLPQHVKKQVFDALLSTRRIKPYFNNWLLFSAMIEAFFCKIGAPYDSMRIDYAVRQLDQWYVGDGMYSDGPEFHNDYYNSYVIQPFLLDILSATSHTRAWNKFGNLFLKRAQRYAEVLERMIAPDGSMPALGRSITYRCGNLHALAHLALVNKLPVTLKPAQIRCAMSAVISRTMSSESTFDSSGWLNVGLCGHQPSLAEDYISTGSQYLAALAFLPLGLAPDHPFWSDADEMFTSQKLYSGCDMLPDKAWDEK